MTVDYDTLFFSVHDFCKSFTPWYKNQLLPGTKKVQRQRLCQLELSEILTIVIAYHGSGKSCFKYFYHDLIQNGRHLFPKLVSYDRFVILVKRTCPALICLFKSLTGEITEYLFIDSTPMSVCHNRREGRHRVFKGIAAKGHTSIGFFFGLKLHMLINTNGDIVRLAITPGNVDDRSPVRSMLEGIAAKLIADKGYISQVLTDDLSQHGTTLITKVRRNMKQKILGVQDKMMLMKRFFIETVFSSMKCLGTLIHHRHRHPINAFAHLFAALIHYQLRTDKPSLNWVNLCLMHYWG